jgi:formate dehydrogenase gamma subunit
MRCPGASTGTASSPSTTANDGKPGERSISMARMHCTDAPCAAVYPVSCFYTTADAVVLHEGSVHRLRLLLLRLPIPNRLDLAWLKAGGGFRGGIHPPAGRFNAGQKVIFWVTVLGGGLVAASGYVLIFPFTVTDIAGQQLSHIVHGLLAVLMVAAMLAHIYIGMVGMEGAIDAMGSGQVDANWAKEHHALWVEQELAKAREAVVVPGAKAAGAS